MNIQKLLFKLFISLSYLIRCWILILPIAIAIIVMKEDGWKYGFTFIQSNLNVAFFIAFAFSFLLSLYHTLSFEEAEGFPDENYLKSHQIVRVRSTYSIPELEDWLASNSRFVNISVIGNTIIASKKVYFLKPDKIRIEHKDDLYTIESRPYFSWWFIDFARNYKTVKRIAQYIKIK